MRVCAVDIHHHYIPQSLLDEARQGKLGAVEAKESKRGETAISFAGNAAFNVPRELAGLKERFEAMERGKIAVGALIPHTSSLGYPLEGKPGEAWCRSYNEGIRDLTVKYPDRFVGL